VRVGLFGGSFDPIHRGHIEPVQEARRLLGLERVLYLPTAVPPHKPGRHLAPALARYAMVELALLHEEGLFASAHELTPERPAYTADTLLHFQRLLPDAELHLLIGSDSFLDFPQWVRWREIVAGARLVVLARPGWDAEALAGAGPPATAAAPLTGESDPGDEPHRLPPGRRADLAGLLQDDRVQVLHQRPCEVSSTRVRELLRCGERPPSAWLPDLVVDFIHKYSLYR
jgi:nicotinate-nucleotide adenylyltransferase